MISITKKLIFATRNEDKKKEIGALIPANFELISLNETEITEEIPETHDTIEENAVEKAQYVYEKTKMNCFADDTGLEIEALNNKPGVFSARYAGANCSYTDNVNKVLFEMKNIENRNAAFRTVIALFFNGKRYLFEGKISGLITKTAKGDSGFGYDPIFMPLGSKLTFAQMPLHKKNQISHRALAFNKLIDFLKK